MSAAAAAGPVRRLARPSRLSPYIRRPAGRRWASSTTEKAGEAAEKAKNTASSTVSNIQSKASEGLTRVKSSAGPALTGASQAVSRNLSKIGGRTGRLIGLVENAIPPTVYYSKVGLELSKLVFRGQKMSLPSLENFQTYVNPLLHSLRNPTALARSSQVANVTPEQAVSRFRNVSRGQMIAAGVVVAEVLGFFSVGEIIGRMKLVGYRGEVHHEH